jgi:hypothetical protein
MIHFSSSMPTAPLVLPAISPEEVVACYEQGEWGDALLFARLFAGQCVYDHTEKAWYLWQGHVWHRDELGRIRLLDAPPASLLATAPGPRNVSLPIH